MVREQYRGVHRFIRAIGHYTELRPRPEKSRTQPYRPNQIELVYWRSPSGVNFGDYLSSVIVTKIAADAGLFLDEERPSPARLLAIGSILHFARNGDIVWGSGV